MLKDAFIYLNHNIYIVVDRQNLVPPTKVAARVSLTGEQFARLMNLSWKEYQSLLEHYFDLGQKLVVA